MLDVDALYRAHGAQIRAYLGRRCSDEHLADDLAQETWLRAVQHADRYVDTGAPITSWLYRIAGNLLTDHYRRAALPQHPHRLGILEATTAHPRDEIARADDRLVLTDALATLTPPQRAVVVLWDIRGYGGDNGIAAGAVLGMDNEAVKACRRRGLACMRRALEAAA